MDDPRLSVKDRLNAKAAAWKKSHDQVQAERNFPDSGAVSDRAAQWQHKAEEHEQTQAVNPFSPGWEAPSYVQPHQDETSYGRPKEGTKTEYRGKQADVRISNEIVELCHVIEQLGVPQKDGTYGVTFGHLFEAYTKISNKLVGMLMRARKQKLVQFEGEMLFQRRDDDTIIWLVQKPEALMADIERRKQELQEHAQFSEMKK